MQPGAGILGLGRRSYERLYYNARELLGNVDYFVTRMVPWAAAHVEQDEGFEERDRHRRIVGRIMMTVPQFAEAMRRSQTLQNTIEAVIPVGEYQGSPIVMAMWGINNHREQTIDPVSVIERETVYEHPSQLSPSERVDVLRQQGYRFVDNLDNIDLTQVYSLWHPIFEWSEEDIGALRGRLQEQKSLSPKRRSVWFTAITDLNNVVALAMAERLDLPFHRGDNQSIIESTEWCVRRGWEGLGLGSGAPSHVHAQVLTDLAFLERPPIIVAETNFTSRADRNGHNSGMIVADRKIASFLVSQVLRQNVAVGDGLRSERLRDFTMMYISSDSVRDYYSSEQRSQILGREV